MDDESCEKFLGLDPRAAASIEYSSRMFECLLCSEKIKHNVILNRNYDISKWDECLKKHTYSFFNFEWNSSDDDRFDAFENCMRK